MKIDKEVQKRKAKAFFHSQTWKKFSVFLLFVVLAFIFWIVQYSHQ
jgi:hypothetical protein